MGELRSTPGWQSQLLAEEINRVGTLAPCARANSPTIASGEEFHGRFRLCAGNSFSFGRYRKEGRSNGSSTAPGFTSWGIGSISCSVPRPFSRAKSKVETAECVVPRSIPTEYLGMKLSMIEKALTTVPLRRERAHDSSGFRRASEI